MGLWDPAALRYLVLTPLLAYLAAGMAFLVLGFASLVRIRTLMKQDGARTDKLERLMTRIGVFSAMYLAPSVALTACLFYEQARLPDWTQLWQETVCRDPFFLAKWQTPCRYPDGRVPEAGGEPSLHLFLAKYFCLLLVGVFSGFWLWCGKTVETWREFFAKICCAKRGKQEAHV